MNKKTFKKLAIIGAALGYYVLTKKCDNNSSNNSCSQNDNCCDGFIQISNSKEV